MSQPSRIECSAFYKQSKKANLNDRIPNSLLHSHSHFWIQWKSEDSRGIRFASREQVVTATYEREKTTAGTGFDEHTAHRSGQIAATMKADHSIGMEMC